MEEPGVATENPRPNPCEEGREATPISKHRREGLSHTSGEGLHEYRLKERVASSLVARIIL